MKVLIISTGFADLEMRDGQLWNAMTFCHADVSSDQSLEITISDAATRAILPIDTPVEVTEVDGRLHVVAARHPDGHRHQDRGSRQRRRCPPTPTTPASSTLTETATPG